MAEGLRLAEILTTSSAVANFLGAREVTAAHVLRAIDVLLGRKTMDDLGRPQSPLLSRATGAGSGVDESVKQVVQAWFQELGGDAQAELTAEQLAELQSDLVSVPGATPADAINPDP